MDYVLVGDAGSTLSISRLSDVILSGGGSGLEPKTRCQCLRLSTQYLKFGFPLVGAAAQKKQSQHGDAIPSTMQKHGREQVARSRVNHSEYNAQNRQR